MTENFELKLNAIAKAWTENEMAEMQFRYLGVNPFEWPPCRARSAVTKFEEERVKGDREYARILATNWLQNLSFGAYPEDADEFRIQYRKELLTARGKWLADRIAKEPARVEELIRDFRLGKDSSIVMKDLKAMFGPTIESLERRIESGQALVTLAGWERLSTGIGGFNPKRVSLLVAGSGVGKTMLALNFAMSANKSGFKVLYFNMEMGEEDLVCRIIQAETHTTYGALIRGEMNLAKVSDLFSELLKSKDILISDGKQLTIEQIVSAVMLHLEGESYGFVIVDYDQKIISKNSDEEWKSVLKTVEMLEECTKQTNAHILVLSQGDDEGQPKASKRSKQPASAVLHLGKNDDNEWFIRTTKNRFGNPNLVIPLAVDGATSRIAELDDRPVNPFPRARVGF